MYRHNQDQLIMPHEFFLPFGGQLDPNNRWVLLAQRIPWNKAEDLYIGQLKSTSEGRQAFSVRMALGALIIKERLGTSDRETVEQIKENPYLQYFIGLTEFKQEEPFHHTMMTHFRKRLGPDIINQINEWLVTEEVNQMTPDRDEITNDEDEHPSDDDENHTGSQSTAGQPSKQQPHSTPTHRGKLILDATCVPADIAYPTDLDLLNKSREKLEHMIDVMHQPLRGIQPKPRTYRKKARQAYLQVAKQRKVSKKKLRKAIKAQLQYIHRNLKHIEELAQQSGLHLLSTRQYRELLVIQEVYRQQKEMYDKRSNRIEDRIVSIEQPHVRPIVRGKAKAPVEFGAKVVISVIEGYTLIEHISWDNFHEGNTLQASVEAYHTRFGCYPEAVIADQLYRTRENRQYCQARGIRLSGPPLGRPAKEVQPELKKLARQDACERNKAEGKFGEGKRCYGLDRIYTRLPETSETAIGLQYFTMNLWHWLRSLFVFFCYMVLLTSSRKKIVYQET